MANPQHTPHSPVPGAPHTASWGQEMRASLMLAVPMAAANLMQMAVYAIDVIFVARLGQRALAVSSLSIAVFTLMVWSLFALTGAVAPVIAAELGAGETGDPAQGRRAIRRTTRMALWLSAGLGAVAMLIAGQGRAILLATGQTQDVAQGAQAFLSILRWAIIPMLMAGVLRQVVSALGRPVFATVITALSIAANAAGNYALVFGHWGAPALGLAGSAWSNVITALVTLAAYGVAVYADPGLRAHRLLHGLWRVDSARLAQLLRIGLPMAGTTLAEAGLFNIAAFLMGRIGELELAAHALALQIASFAFMLPMGVGQAASIRVGYHYGAGDQAGVGRAGACAVVIGLGAALFSGAAMVLAPRLMLSAYVDIGAPAQAALLALAVQYMLIAAAFQLFDATQAILAGALRGLQDTRVPMGIALAGYWLPGFGLAAGLGLMTPLRGLGVWIGLAAGLVVVSIGLGWRWHRRGPLGLMAPR
ncbi:MATE family efflux transporter [Novosphingobium sp. FSY-8]|uniref:MATE family efflux transporter n=1 Tax=Novosphingobium ovatum TaxID=1908523 RepID=A0ABW9XEW0_9SPHN|nr:MATE family efflux transporter [Novosphingobium ovatum]NBC37078.1 MATE family efflux transporter [Novosphingobium ovatum]